MPPSKIGLLAALVSVGLPVSALALETGQCLPAAQVRATLAAENQNPIIIGNRTGYGYPTAFIFTSDATGSRGYLLRGDKPLGQQADTICIDSVYRDIRLNDITRPGIPAWATMTVDAARAETDCREHRLGYQESCRPHNVSLTNQYRGGARVMFMATGSAINPRDRSMYENQRVILFVDPQTYEGGLRAISQSGASYMLSGYSRASYSQYGQALLPPS